MTVTDATELGRARRARLKRMDAVHPIVGEIVETLQSLGGAAHRDLVADRIAEQRGGQSLRASEALRSDIFQAFEAHCEAMPAATGRLLFCKPFGADSHRWALSASAREFLAQSRDYGG